MHDDEHQPGDVLPYSMYVRRHRRGLDEVARLERVRDLVDGDVGRYVLERAHPGSVLEALRRIFEPLEALAVHGVDLGVCGPDFLRV